MRRHRSLAANSAYFCSLSALAFLQTMPSSQAAPGLATPLLVTALRMVMMSTANWAPCYSGSPEASTSMHRSSRRRSCPGVWRWREQWPPPPRRFWPVFSRVLLPSCTAALNVDRRPGDVLHCPQALHTLARDARHKQWQPQPFQDEGAEEFWLHSELWAPGPMEHMRASAARMRPQVSLVAADRARTTVFLKWYSEAEDAWTSQPCAHSPGSVRVAGAGRAPNVDP